MPENPTPAQREASRQNGRQSDGRPTERGVESMVVVSFRALPSERDEIYADADQSSAKSRSEYMRSTLIGKRLHSNQDLALYKELVNNREEIKRQGGLLKHAIFEGFASELAVQPLLDSIEKRIEIIDQFVEKLSLAYARRGAKD